MENRIAWVRFNRPEKRNAMSPALNRQMMRVLDELEFRDDVGVLVLTGEGTSWTAGMDLQEYFRETEVHGLAGTRKAQRESYGWWRRLALVPKAHHRHDQRLVLSGGGYGPLFACDLALLPTKPSLACPKLTGASCPVAVPPRWRRLSCSTSRRAMYTMPCWVRPSTARRLPSGVWSDRTLPLAQLKERVTAVAEALLKKNPVALKTTRTLCAVCAK